MQTGLLNAIPFGIASVLMILWGRRSDRSGERVWHTALPLALLAISLAVGDPVHVAGADDHDTCAGGDRDLHVKGPFWALSTEWLSAGAAAAGIAQINAHRQSRRLRRDVAARRDQGRDGQLCARAAAARAAVGRGGDSGRPDRARTTTQRGVCYGVVALKARDRACGEVGGNLHRRAEHPGRELGAARNRTARSWSARRSPRAASVRRSAGRIPARSPRRPGWCRS